jgi:hypothetical protein
VARRARWIADQKAYFAQFDPRTPPRRYVSGETHLYLGRRYRLKVEAGEEDSVRLRAGRLVVKLRDVPAATSVAELVTAWYAEKAAERLAERAEICWDRLSGHGRPIPRLRIRRMRSRWGSMSTNGLLTGLPEIIGTRGAQKVVASRENGCMVREGSCYYSEPGTGDCL